MVVRILASTLWHFYNAQGLLFSKKRVAGRCLTFLDTSCSKGWAPGLLESFPCKRMSICVSERREGIYSCNFDSKVNAVKKWKLGRLKPEERAEMLVKCQGILKVPLGFPPSHSPSSFLFLRIISCLPDRTISC